RAAADDGEAGRRFRCQIPGGNRRAGRSAVHAEQRAVHEGQQPALGVAIGDDLGDVARAVRMAQVRMAEAELGAEQFFARQVAGQAGEQAAGFGREDPGAQRLDDTPLGERLHAFADLPGEGSKIEAIQDRFPVEYQYHANSYWTGGATRLPRWLTRLAPRSEEHTSELQSRENLVC